MPIGAVRAPLFPPCRIESDGYTDSGRHLWYQPGRWWLPGHQPNHSVRPQELQHRCWGGGILSGMSPKGFFDEEGAEALISSAKAYKAKPPGSVDIHYDETGFFRYKYEEETGVLDGLKEYMRDVPAYKPKFFQVAQPKEPAFKPEDLYRLIPFNQKQMYSFDEILSRLVDGSEHMEFRPDYGPEIYTGLVKLNGFLVGCIGNRQGWLGEGYPNTPTIPASAASFTARA